MSIADDRVARVQRVILNAVKNPVEESTDIIPQDPSPIIYQKKGDKRLP